MSAKGKVKLVAESLSVDVSLACERQARALAIIGRAFMEAAQIMVGKPAGSVEALFAERREDCTLTVLELVNEYLLAKARAQASDRYLRQLRVCLSSFKDGRARTPIAELEVQDIERWTRGRNWSNRTIRGYVADVRSMLNYAVKRGYIGRNPAAAVEMPVCHSEGQIHIHTPTQVRAVLECARRANADVCRRLAVRYFAGVRSAEANRLAESDLKLEQNLIEVSAAKSKTRARRLVTIQPNLRAWLKLGGELRGMGDTTVLETIRKSGVEWHHNVTRHSFVSYHLAKFESASKTALEAGHSEQMLFKHYRALVTPAAAAEFWEIMPGQ